MREILRPLAWVYDRVTALRNRYYDEGVLPAKGFNVAIVSIGNMTLGGTGKTPLMGELVEWASQNKLHTAVVSRGYKGNIKGVAEVPKSNPDPEKFGDEPVMIARRFPSVPVFIGAKRIDAVQALLNAYPQTQVVFADDAFQHRSLRRSLDIVVMDCTEAIENYRLVPLGRGRESIQGLRRCDYVILNKVNLVQPDQKQKILELIEEVRGDQPVDIIESEYYVKELRHLLSGEKVEPSGHEPILAVSAIGNPQSFADLLKMKLDVKGHLKFRDHHKFTDEDVRYIVQTANDKGVKKIVMTEKDATKVSKLSEVNDLFWVAELRPMLSLKVRHLHDKIMSYVR